MDRYDMSHKQIEWWQRATEPERMAFILKGPVHILTFMSRATMDTYLGSAVRGVRINHEKYSTEAEAIAAGEAFLEELRQRTDLPVLDEDALGINDRNYRMASDAWDASVRVDHIYHLGTMMGAGNDALPDDLEQVIEDFSDIKHPPAAAEDLPGLGKMVKSAVKEFGRREGVGEALGEYTRQRGTYGFLIKVATPVMKYAKDGNSASLSWGYCHCETFYGETFEEAWAKALKWADDWREKEKAEAMKTAEVV